MWADIEVVKYISGKPSTQEESWSRLLRYSGHWKLLGFGYWVVEQKEDGQFVGEVGFADYQRELTPPQNDSPEAGWVLTASKHGKGYATEAVSCIVSWADRYIDQRKTFCMLDPQHAASIKVARKVGYAQDAMGTYGGDPTLVLSRATGTTGTEVGNIS